MDLGPKHNVEFMARFDEAEAAFAHAVMHAVPAGLTVRDRKSGNVDVGPNDTNYGAALNRFKEDVSSIAAVAVLKFLYAMEKDLSRNFSRFKAQYKDVLETDRMIRIEHGYPRLDQTTIARCMPFLAETTVQTRLEDLERAGLVERSPSKPPFPKHAWITKKGEAVIESAVAAAVEALAPVMTTAAIAEPECVKETGG